MPGGWLVSESRSGTPTMPRAARRDRGRPVINVSLPAEALARLDEIAADRQTSRSGAIVQLIRNARMRDSDSK